MRVPSCVPACILGRAYRTFGAEGGLAAGERALGEPAFGEPLNVTRFVGNSCMAMGLSLTAQLGPAFPCRAVLRVL